MSTVLYILLGILLLCILVVVHEWGHFIAARIVGIQVQEFSVGFGPKLLQHTAKTGMKVSLRAIPLGGYCAFYGEDEGDAADPRSYYRQSPWKRMFSVIMGPGMNFILAFLVATGFYWINGTVQIASYEPYVEQVLADSVAEAAGLKDGDKIEIINGVNVQDGTFTTLQNAISDWRDGDAPLEMTITRDGETVHLSVTPVYDEEEGRSLIGVMLNGGIITEPVGCTLGQSIQLGWDWCVYAGSAIFSSLKNLVTGVTGLKELSGPVGIVTAVGTQVEQYGLDGFLNLLILISINLGIMNLLPIPGLDGSKLIFLLIEVIRKKPVPPEKEAVVHLIGYALLIILMLFCTWQDIARLL